MFKTEKGITLVALVITIIVMLILAGVSISLVLDKNGGLITRATQAVNTHQQGEKYEQNNLKSIENSLENIIQQLEEGKGGNLNIPSGSIEGFDQTPSKP